MEMPSLEQMTPDRRHRYLVGQVKSLVNRFWLQVPLSAIKNEAYPFESLDEKSLMDLYDLLVKPQTDARDLAIVERAREAVRNDIAP